MLEIVFLGTGSGPPTPHRNHASVFIRYEQDRMLFDCGEGTQRQIITAGLNFMKIRHIFISHWHADHWIGLIGLFYTMSLEGRKEPVYIYGPDADRFVQNVKDMNYWGTGFNIIPKNVPYEGNIITKVYENDDYEILSIPTKHTVPSVSYAFVEKDRENVDISLAEKKFGLKQGPMIGKLKSKGEIEFKGNKITMKDVMVRRKGVKVVYTGDTEPCENIVKISKDADVLIHDATFVEVKEDRMHSGAKESAKIAKKAGVKSLILTHFSRRYQSVKELEDESRKIFRNTKAARDFMKVNVSNEGVEFSS
ncbi:MAG: ribonuclease Z [Candidatus Aenigmarchaeota archaeon]|nr:ribonuclease Z [Candidatus Aenigmarchaeota archaeon]